MLRILFRFDKEPTLHVKIMIVDTNGLNYALIHGRERLLLCILVSLMQHRYRTAYMLYIKQFLHISQDLQWVHVGLWLIDDGSATWLEWRKPMQQTKHVCKSVAALNNNRIYCPGAMLKSPVIARSPGGTDRFLQSLIGHIRLVGMTRSALRSHLPTRCNLPSEVVKTCKIEHSMLTQTPVHVRRYG